MKNRSLVITLLAVFSAICVWNIYWTTTRISLDQQLSDMNAEQRSAWLKDPDNVSHYKRAVDRSFSLGLDLQGGMYITLEIGVDEVVAGLASNRDATFERALVAARKDNSSQTGFVDAFVQELKKADPNARLAAYFASRLQLPITASDAEVQRELQAEADAAIANAFEVLRRRIDQFGVASPNIQEQPGTGRILVELPGVKDADRVRKLLRGTARLEFWPTYTANEGLSVLLRINERVKQLAGTATDTASLAAAANEAGQTGTTPKADTASSAGNLAEALGQKPTGDTTKSSGIDSTASEAVQRAQFEKQNPFFAAFQAIQRENGNSPALGYVLVSDTNRVNRWLERPEIRSLIPGDMRLLWTAKPEAENSQVLTLLAIRGNREGKAPLTGDVIVDARQDFEDNGATPSVSMTMNAEGAQKWKKMTTDYLQKSIAVVLDNQVYTYPNVNNVIANGSSSISGNFSIEEAKDLANILKAGKLPAPARIEGEEIVGPTLGTDTTQRGLVSFGLSFAAVLLFLLAYYRGSGLVAIVALVFNLFLVIGISSAMNIVMTLPGIAGIVLSLAMAVDSNVLIYERIREELQAGRNFRAAIKSGFQNALSAIVDGNVTTFLTGLILFAFGSGPIRGFAVTLMIGIVTTLVAALLVTRLILDYYANKSETTNLNFGQHSFSRFFRSLNIDLIGKRRAWYGLTGALVVAAAVAIAVFGFRTGVDFQGGRQYVVGLNVAPSEQVVESVRQDLTNAFQNNQPIVKTVGSKDQLMITTSYLVDDPGAAETVEAALIQGIKQRNAGLNPTILRSSTVGPTVADDIKTGALYAVVFSLLVMFVYIFIRFRRAEFGLASIIGLAFNTIMVLGLFALLGSIDALPFSAEVDQTFIAALLTILGYTINDTVVVFDRIREMSEDKYDRAGLDRLYNRAINDTFSRTIITAVTTLLSALILFFFGGDVLKGFMLALFFGIVAGTYSSILIASPLSLDLILGRNKKQTPATPQRVAA